MPILPPDRDSGWLTQVSRRAMATEFVIMLAAQHADAVEFALDALEQLDVLEQQLTIYRPDSEVSRINREAASQPVQVSESTFDIIHKAVQWSVKTEGRFDITAGPLVQAWGFTNRQGRKPTQSELEAALELVGYEKLILDPDRRTIGFSVPGMSVNLGGIGKGYAIDRIAERLVERGIHHFLIHGGQSSVLASGNQSSDDDDALRGWAVGIAHPTRSKIRLAGFWLRDGALGTSGSGKQFFHYRGQRFGHVIDPRSGYPTTDLISLSTVAANATDADAAGTGMYLAGSRGLRKMASSSEQTSDQTCAGWPVIAVQTGSRLDELMMSVTGHWDWIDPPSNLAPVNSFTPDA